MTIKISVSADTSAVQSELKKVQDSAEKINKALSSGEVGLNVKDAKNDLADLEVSAKKLVELLDKAKSAGVDLSSVNFDDVSQSLDDAAKAADVLERVLEAVGQSSGMSQTVKSAKQTADELMRASGAQKSMLSDREKYDRARKSGVAGTKPFRNITFDDVMGEGWRGVNANEATAKRQTRDMLKFAGAQIPPQLAAPSEQEKQEEKNKQEKEKQAEKAKRDAASKSRESAGRYAAMAGAAGGFVGSTGQGGMYSSLGGMAGSGLGAGAGMLLGGPVGAVVGAFASRALGGLGAGIDNQVGNIGGEGAIYTDLRRSLGATSIDFDMLRGSVRHFSDGLGLAYNESAKLAKEFAHTANLNADNGMSVGGEVKSAVGFGRGFGISPEQSVSFMASMRQMGVTSSEQGNRKLALQIAESVKNGGTTAKMDEVLNSIQGYVQNSTRQSLTGSDPAAFASFLASMTGSSLNGVKGNPMNSAAIMASADMSMRQGGGFGEASKNFSLGLWQRNMQGFTALDQDYMNEQGAFGSIDKAFGKDSAAYKFAEERGDSAKMAQYDEWSEKNKGKSVMDMQMGMLEKEYGGNTDMFRKSIQSHFGVGAGQASALYQAWKNNKSLGGLESQLKDAGIDTSKMDTRQIASLAELTTADRDGLGKQANRLQGLKGTNALTDTEKKQLEDARGNDEESFRKVVLKLSEKHNALGDAGDEQRRVQADMNNAMQELATKMIPLTIAIKDGIVELVRWASPKSDFVKQQDAEKAKEQKNKSDAEELDKQIEERKATLDDKNLTPQERERHEAMYNQLVKKRNAIQSIPSNYDAIESSTPNGNRSASADSASNSSPNDVPTKSNLSAEEADEKVQQLTSNKHALKNMRNNNPGNIRYGDWAKNHGAIGKDKDGFAVFPDKDMGSRAMDTLLKRYIEKDGRKTVRSIVSKYAPPSENDTESYIARVSKKLGVKDNDSLDSKNPKLMAELAKQMTRIEGDPKAYVDQQGDNRTTPKEIAAQNLGKEQEESKVSPKVNGAANAIKASDESKVPAGAAAAQNQAGGSQKVSFNGEFVLRDSSGRQIAEPILKTGFSAPRPSGVVA